jgi:subtilase family serine protease
MKLSLSLFISDIYKMQGRSGVKFSFKGSRNKAFGLAVGLFMTAGACTAQAQIAPEFRTAPRSLITEKVDRSRLVPTVGALNPIVANYVDLGEVQGSLPIQHIQLLLKRTPERQASFDAQVEALHTKGSASFHKWLTPDVVGAEFGPSASDISTITSYLQSEGLTVDHVGKSGLYIDFSGTAAQIEHTFQTKIHSFQLQDESHEVKYAAVQEASIPQAISPAVVGLVSLSNILSAHTNYRKVVVPALQATLSIGVKALDATPYDTESTTNYAVGPQDFYTIYNENPLLSAGIDGRGVTVAVLEESAINAADVINFRTTYGVTPATPVSFVTDTGYGTNTCTAPALLESTGEEGEAVLDAEWAGAAAPGANLIFMQCAAGAVLGVFYSAEAVIDNNLADVMSLSYGQYEGYNTTQDTLALDLWEQAASQGETVVVSAGDTGAAAEDGNYGDTYAKYGITASSFSTTAWNVSAGGTDFLDTYNGSVDANSNFQIGNYWSATNGTGLSSALSYIPETTWNDTCASSIYNALVEGATASLPTLCGATALKNLYLAAGGGAPSSLTATRPRPIWQQGTVFGLPTTTAYPTRLQPDVSLFASNGFWYHDLPSYESDAGGTSYAGGTSFVAPQLAGMFALIRQSTGERLGQPNYVLYSMAGTEFGTTSAVTNSCNGSGASGIGETTSSPASTCIFYDIQSGTSSVDCRTGSPNCYVNAGKTYGVLSTSTTALSPAFSTNAGWDQATGIGSINIANLVNNWQNTTTGKLYMPTVTLAINSASVAVYGTADPLTATVSGSGSYPTGSVTFTATPTVGSVGVATILGTAPCSTGGTCVEQATQSIYPTIPASDIPYSITATYSSTNENYVSGVTSTPVTVTIVSKQTPTTAVQNATAATSNSYAVLTATITYTGVGAPPSGGMNFSLPTGAVMNGACTGTSSPLACSVNYPISPATYPVGNYTITASYPGDGNYNAVAAKTATLTVNNGTAPTITFTTASPQYTMYPTVALTSTSNSSGAISYSYVSGPATVSGSTATLTGGSGTVVVKISQAGSGAYIAGSTTGSFTVKAGSVWVTDASDDLSTFDLSTGAVITASPGLSGGGVGTTPFPQPEAFDASGNLWVASSNGISEFSPSAAGPVAVSSAAYSVGGVTTSAPPLALAVDGLGNIWTSNYNGTVTELSNTGSAISPSTGYTASGVTAPYVNVGGIAIDLSGSVWVTNFGDGSVTQLLGVAAPAAPLSTALANGTTGVRP